MAEKRLLFVGAHAADEIVAGGTIARCVQEGGVATLLFCTLGEKGHPTLTPDVYARQKQEEAIKAAAVLGAAVKFLNYQDAELPVAEEVQWQIADVIREVKPTLVITHWRESLHPDHTNTHHNTLAALFKAGIKWLERPLPAHGAWRVYFGENWEDKPDFNPHAFVDVTSAFDQWAEAVRQYALFRGEVVKFPYFDYYAALKRVRGAESGFAYAEAFAVEERAKRLRLAELP